VPPDRTEIDPAALRLLERHGRQILATARRYSASADDAEDAYQRGLEILLTKAPTTREQELVPWLKTVVKHEAFAIRRQRERATPTTDDDQPGEGAGPEAAAHDHAERYERLRVGAEALRRLKPQEVRCLVLKAEGYSYKEICRLTGWTYTKVNRCLTEGRKAFLERVAGIEAGRECERLAPLISKLADGEAGAAEVRALRPHLRGCLVCRERLRGFRAAPARVAALAPAAAAAGPLRGAFESLVGAAQHKAAAITELAAGQKVAAVAASAAALGGGGAAATQLPSSTRPAHAGARAAEVRQHTDARPVTTPAPQSPVRQPVPSTGAPAPPPPTPAPASPPPAAAPTAHDEFAPDVAAAASPSAPRSVSDRAPPRRPSRPQSEFGP
jgi:RNA polymerase sigma factor (sigma-70 family)